MGHMWVTGHCTHFQVGGDNSKVEGGGILHNQYAKQSHILLSLWHFHLWKQSSRVGNAIRLAICPDAVECHGVTLCQDLYHSMKTMKA